MQKFKFPNVYKLEFAVIYTHLDKGGQNAHPKSPLFQKILENIFLETKKPPISLVIEVNRRRVEIFIILVYNRKLRERQI